MKKRTDSLIRYFGRNLGVVIGLVLIWRGIWLLLDGLDKFLFEGSHFITAPLGIIIGFIILYLPDKDLKEIQKL